MSNIINCGPPLKLDISTYLFS